jgi:signal transduction histidine kinase/integral membrane sensor domain MASE1
MTGHSPLQAPLGADTHPIVLTLGTALAYFLTGKLALLLAIPPGYATAVWPPAGIALAAALLYGPRIWPGVLLGSFLANLSASFDATSVVAISRSTGIAAMLGIGAALQATASAWLVRRFAPDSLQLTSERQVFALFALGGPVGCLINATVGVSTLLATGVIPKAAAGFSWWTWWVGDSIGALIFTPLLLMWLGDPNQWRSRRWPVCVPLLGMLCAAVLVFVYASRSEQRELQSHFNDEAARIANDIERRVALNTETLRAVGGLFVASDQVEADEFGRLADLLLPAHPEIRALGWAPRVTADQRAAFEARLRAEGLAHGIIEMDAGKLIRAGERAEYFPLLMSEIGAVRGRGRGIDIAGESARRNALQVAVATGSIAATGPISFLSRSSVPNGVLIVLPVKDSREEQGKHGAVRGFVIGGFRIEQLIRHAVGAEGLDGRVRLTITDVSTTPGASESVLYESHDSKPETDHSAATLDLRTVRTLQVGGRTWELSFTPTPAYFTDERSIIAWLVLACGLLLTALVGAGALILTGRTKQVAALVRTRTEELARINEQLAVEICDHIATETKLNSEREFLKTVLENLNEGILVFDEHGTMTMSNRAAREVHVRIAGRQVANGRWMEQYELREADGLTSITPELLPRERALRGETVRDYELVAIAPERTPVSLMVTSQPLVNAEGNHSGAITLVRDISDAKRADRLKREFVSVVSHELRTPLTSIRGSIGLVAAGATGELPPKAKQLLEIAYRNTDRLSALIDDILDIEKIEAGKAQLTLRRTQLSPLLELAMEANAGYATSCEVSLQLHHPFPAVEVNVDANRLLQVMANLLSNAAKFSPRGGRVDVTVTLRAGRVRVCVRDNGPGIPADFREQIFQKFSQADGSDTRSKSGTGLGLAISKALIERMHGTIDFESQPGCGASFFFELPIVTSDQVTR